MITRSKEKIKNALKLVSVIEARRALEKQEAELKEWAKKEAKDGVLEAGGVIILIETKNRSSIDREKLAIELGERVKEFERVTQYEQVTVKQKVA